MVSNDTKSFYLSKTFWFNVLAFVGLVAVSFGYGDFQVDPAVAEYASVAIVIINLILRFVTKQGVTLS